MHTVAGFGELLWDILPGGKQMGGAPGNFACHIGALGEEGVVISRVGDDSPGRELLARLDKLGVGHEYVTIDPAHPTGRSTVELDAKGVPSFLVHENVAWDFIEYTPRLADFARNVDAVYFGTLPQRSAVSGETVRLFLKNTRPSALRLFDANLRRPHFSRDVVEVSLETATAAKLNDAELDVLGDYFSLRGEAATQLRRLVDRFELKLAALTRGERGSLLVAGDRTAVHPGCPTRVADTVGAGDAFAATLVVGLLAGLDIDRINEQANRVASFVCSKPGATPALPRELLEDLV
ncbi:MAG: carbohydrate kinase [Candidatus Latescibacterota bacterium]|nr:MAG: carbohydrate kinase [Candidatus Latescibacterota bacterium]